MLRTAVGVRVCILALTASSVTSRQYSVAGFLDKDWKPISARSSVLTSSFLFFWLYNVTSFIFPPTDIEAPRWLKTEVLLEEDGGT